MLVDHRTKSVKIKKNFPYVYVNISKIALELYSRTSTAAVADNPTTKRHRRRQGVTSIKGGKK